MESLIRPAHRGLTPAGLSPAAGRFSLSVVALRLVIAALTMATAWIHFSLGGLLFTANAAGYATLGLAMITPLPVAGRYRWLIRIALLGFTGATIGGWLILGARFPLAYIDKGIESLLVGCLVREIYRDDGGFVQVGRRLLAIGRRLLAAARGPWAAGG